jgi:YozE SAM-like protein
MKQDINPTIMTFYQWLTQFRKQDNVIGDVVGEVGADHCFLRKTTRSQKILDDITFDHYACKAFEDILGNALDRYKKGGEG